MKRIVLSLILLFPSLAVADGTLYVSPERGTYTSGEVFQVRVLANTGGQSINAAEAELDFDPRALSVVSIATDGSILSSWSTQPTYSNPDGTIEFSGWADKKYAGTNGLLITVTFKALRSMSGNARFAAGAILAADGQGSNILSSMKSATFTIRGSTPLVAVPAPAPARTTPPPVAAVHDAPPVIEDVSPARALQEDGIVKPDAPSLAEYPRTISVGERIYLKGTSDPDTPIKVYLQYSDNSPKTERLMSSADGSFTYASDEITRAGIYYVWAQEERGSMQSDQSRMVKIEVQSSGLTASVREAAALVEASTPFLVILAFFGLSIGYFLHRHANVATHRDGHIS